MDASKVSCIAGTSCLGFPIFIREFELIYICDKPEFKLQLSWMEKVHQSQTHLRPSG